MKKHTPEILLVTLMLTLCCFIGCTTTPPTAWEQRHYVIETNYVTQVRTVTNTVTQVIPQVVPVFTTNVQNQVELVFHTNLITVPVKEVIYETNQVPASYNFTPNSNSAALASTSGAVSNLIAPGSGGLVAAVIGMGLGIWGQLRSRKANTVAATLAQGIEVYGEVVKGIKGINGKDIDSEVKAWLQQNQAETGTIEAVLKLLKTEVDNPSATAVANEIQKFIDARKVS